MTRASQALVATLLLPALLAAQEAVDDEAVKFFVAEGTERSQVMDHLSWMCDVHGPRVTGSPNLRRAQRWAAETLSRFGYSAKTESWGPFGRGWRCEHVNVAVIGDNPWPVLAHPKAWSPGIDGRVEAEVVHVATMDAEVLKQADLSGKIVLIDSMRAVNEPFDGPSRRFTSDDLLAKADQRRSEALSPAARARGAQQGDFRMNFQRRRQMLALVQQQKPLAIFDRGSKGEYGTVFVSGASAASKAGQRASARDADADVIPQFTLAVEHYNRLCRVLAKGLPIRIAIELRATFYDDDLDDYNVVATMPGSDAEIGEQFAMMGAHFDSWQSGTGATDNGCGSAVVMEASRLIAEYCRQTGKQPRRTIRSCLWSGEEQGLLGSRAYVRDHLGTNDEPKSDRALVSGYFNLDNGTGKVRGVYLQGNEAIAPIFRAWLRPFHVHGASTMTLDDTGGTDHLAFHGVGVPGFQFIQDPVSYSTRTHHSSMDNWDHAVAEDLMQASIVMASFVWHTAQRDEMLPRQAVQPGGGRRGR